MNIVASLIVASLFVPQGSEEQIINSPLANGEVAYVNGEAGESFAYVGTNDKQPNRVVDETALRGYEHYYLDRSEFVVLAVSNLTRNANNDSLEFTNLRPDVTNTFVFTISIPHKYKFSDVEFYARKIMDIAARHLIDTKVYSDNIVTVTIDGENGFGNKVIIDDFKVKVLKYGSEDYVNDLTKKIIYIQDTANEDSKLPHRVASWHLGEWRRNLLHYYDGNRGEDWAEYNAKKHVSMGDRNIQFGGTSGATLSKFEIGMDDVNTNAAAAKIGGRTAMTIYETESSAGGTEMRFTSISATNGVATMQIALSGAVFDASYLKLFASDYVGRGDSSWRQISYTLLSSNPITITTPQTGRAQFYRVSYGNSSIVVEITDTLKVDRLLLKGDNGSYYRIVVNSSGVLTATLVQ